MIEITYPFLFLLITILWIGIRIAAAIRNRRVDWLYELKLLTVYICIVVITRIVYFPWHLVDGHIGPLVFDPGRIFPLWINAVPFVHLFDIYEGWQRNVFGNIAMFIPVGLAWPFCFKQLNTIGKVVLAGFGFSLLIELSQLLFYERGIGHRRFDHQYDGRTNRRGDLFRHRRHRQAAAVRAPEMTGGRRPCCGLTGWGLSENFAKKLH